MGKEQNKELRRARDLLRRKKYPQVIRFLEPKLPLYLDSVYFYYLLGRAFFLSGDLGSAELYLKRGLRVQRDSRELNLALAAVFFKRHQTSQALRTWLDILERNPKDRCAERALKVLKKGSHGEAGETLLQSEKLFLPRIGPPVDLRRLAAWCLLVLGVAGGGVAAYWLAPLHLNQTPTSRKGVIDFQIEKFKGDHFVFSGHYRYYLTESALKESLSLLEGAFEEYRDNVVTREINRIKYSNASNKIKSKVLLLEKFVTPPDMLLSEDSFSYEEVMLDPYLYENSFVLWKGKVTNRRTEEGGTWFDFLVGYEENQLLQGVIPVCFEEEISLASGLGVELLGQVIREESRTYLKGKTVRILLSSS